MADQNEVKFKDDALPDATFAADSATTNKSSASATGAAASAVTGTVSKLKEGASHLVSEASEAAMTAANEGKEKAAAALGDLTQTVENAAQLIEEKVGPAYSGYVRNAGKTVSSFAETLQNKNVDELLDDTRAFVRRSPMVAIGAAAAIGFVLTRLIKVGTDDTVSSGRSTGRTNGTSA